MSRFKYLGRTLDQTDDNWPDILRKINRDKKFLGIMGKIMRREGEDTQVLSIFYRVVVQVVLLFGSES